MSQKANKYVIENPPFDQAKLSKDTEDTKISSFQAQV